MKAFGLFALVFCIALSAAPPAVAGVVAGFRPAIHIGAHVPMDRRGDHFGRRRGQGGGLDGIDASGVFPAPQEGQDAEPVVLASEPIPPFCYPPREPAYVSNGPRLILVGHRRPPNARGDGPVVIYGDARP